MDTFWTVWIIAVVLLALLTMYYIVGHYYKKRNTENYDHVLNTFDGIEEHDGPVPRIIWLAYFLGLIMALVYFLYMPALGSFKGFGDFQPDTTLNADYLKSLDEQIAELNPADSVNLTKLAKNTALVSAGRQVFQNNCIACHRQNAQGQKMFPNLTDTDWLNGSGDAQILESIAKGRKRIMPPWESVLQDQQINDLTNYLISLNKERLPFASQIDISGGRILFKKHCVSCHGNDATGNQELGAPNLTDDIWLYGGDKKMITQSIKYGLDGPMPAFETRLTRPELIAVATYIKHFATDAYEKRATKNKVEKEKENTLLAKGEYLARIGDCIACHTAAEGGEPLAGGLAFNLPPMGIIHSTNISQHADSGLGTYTYDEFYNAMKTGEGKNGYLYPAMPYTSFKYVKDDDIKAIWAYLKSVNPRPRKNEENTGLFSFNIRFPLAIWSMMFRGDDVLNDDEAHSKPWNRGKYLVLGLGHCSECHTPRNLAQAMEWDSVFKGNLIDGWQAPDISATMLFRQGWTVTELAGFLKHGYSDKGTVFAGMAEVISNSTRYLTQEDAQAMATYLIEGDASIGNIIDTHAEKIVHSGLTNDAYADKSYELFTKTCGACHGVKGEGRQGIAPVLNGNSVFSLDDYYNSVAVILRGLDPDFLSHDGDMPMAQFDSGISDAKVAELASFARKYFGGQDKAVTTEEVTTIRQKLNDDGFTPEFHKKAITTERSESM